MILIVGLGNPGKKYINNRHNVGFQFVDYINRQIKNKKIKIVKTNVFMNNSGLAIKQLISQSPNLPVSNLIIIHDDLDIPLGKFHIQFAVGPQLHNGLESIEQHLKTKDFWRVRIGIDNRLPDKRIPGEAYTLQNFSPEEKTLLETEIFPKIFSQLKLNFKML
ncbi:aminoacyl-tRNA hydrolase [Candidatus Roizmanbacteria bacterium]|nr:aminoacyl-tRNA hydrolase [Candidatus Roizmanbacteria bacterium]